MAEFVERRVEEFAPLLNILHKNELYSQSELRNIVYTLRDLESGTQKSSASSEDYFKFLNYMVNFRQNVECKKKGKQWASSDCLEIEKYFRMLVYGKIEFGVKKFSHSIKFWYQLIGILKQLNWYGDVSKVYRQMLIYLGARYLEIWCEAQVYELSLLNTPFAKQNVVMIIDSARKMIMEGLRIHTNSLALHLKGFKMELEILDILRKNPALEKEYTTDLKMESDKLPKIQLDLAKVYYTYALKTPEAKHADTHMQFYDVSLQYQDTESLKACIFETLLTLDSSSSDGIMAAIKIKFKEKCPSEALLLFDEVLEKFQYSPDIMESSIKFLFNEWKKDFNSNCLEKLMSLLRKGINERTLTEDSYFIWGEVIDIRREKLRKARAADDVFDTQDSELEIKSHIYKRGAQATGSLKLQKAYIVARLLDGRVCEDDPDSINIRKLIKWLNKLPAEPKVDLKFYEDVFLGATWNTILAKRIQTLVCCTTLPLEVQGLYRKMYLNRIGLTNIPRARKFFAEVHKIPPFSEELHMAMINLEKNEPRRSEGQIDRIRQCYRVAEMLFGDSSVDIWISHLEFEEKELKPEENMGHVVTQNALSRLKPELIEQFKERSNIVLSSLCP